MGLFSYDCVGCGHPLLSPYAVESINQWMMDGVAIEPASVGMAVVMGEYDGYGRLDGRQIDDRSECWHKSCWIVAGKPLNHSKPSKWSADQGYFFDDGDHDMPDPLEKHSD